ncbi:hypothetical protein BTHI11S_00282 [Bosea thiooxidans]
MIEARAAIACGIWISTGPSQMLAVERSCVTSRLSALKATSARYCSNSDRPSVTAIWLISGTFSAGRMNPSKSR